MLFASNIYALSVLDGIKKLFSISISDDIFDVVNKDIIGSLHAKNLRFYFPNRVSMDDLEVLDENGERVLYGKHVEASVSLISLLTNNIVVSDALVEAPFFRYTIKNGIHSIIRVFESPPNAPKEKPNEKSKFRVTIAHVRVQNGSYEMTHDVGLKIIAEGINAEGNFWVEKGPFGVDIPLATISRGIISVAGMDLPISELAARDLWISDEKVSTEHLTAYYERALLEAKGTVFIKKKHYALNARLNTPKNTYPRGLTKLPFIPPKIIADIVMAGSLVDPEFSINAQMGETEFNGLKINSGLLTGSINSHRIAVESSLFNVGDNGQILANGIVDIDKKSFNLLTKQKNIKSKDLLKFLSLDFSSEGLIDATSDVRGSFSLEQPISIQSKGSLRNASFDQAQLARATQFALDMSLLLPKELSFNKILINDNLGSKVEGRGTIAMANKSGSFSYILYANKPEYYSAYWLPKKLSTSQVHTTGNISWSAGSLNFEGSLAAQSLNYESIKTYNIKTNYSFKNDNLTLTNVSGDIFRGKAQGILEIKDIKNAQKLRGQLDAEGLDLAAIGQDLSEIVITGEANAKISLFGTLKKPQANFTVDSAYLSLDKIDFRNTLVQGSYTPARIDIFRLSSATNSGSIEGSALAYDFNNEAMAGTLFLSEISLAPLVFKYGFPVEALLNGPVKLGGTWSLPEINAPLTVKNLIVAGQKFGSGSLALSLKKDKLLDVADEDLIFSLSSLLKEGRALSDIRFALALNRRTTNTTISLSDFPLDSLNLAPEFNVLGVKGRLFAHLSIEGPLMAPRLNAEASFTDYTFFDPRKRNSSLLVKKKHGPATLKASIDKGNLSLALCAPFSMGKAGEDCHFEKGLSLNANGPFTMDEYSVDVDGSLNYDHIEELLPMLNDELVTVDASTRVKGKLIKQRNKDLIIALKLYFDRIFASLPNTPYINLNKAFEMSLNNDGISINKEIIFTFSPGQMVINGDILNDYLNINLNGAIPLVFTKFFAPIIQRGDGLAVGDLKITGPLNAPLFEGSIAPEKGATLSFKKWIESMEFREGKIKFSKTSPHSFEGYFEDIKLGIGDGKLGINGRMKKRYQSPKKSELMTFDIKVEGSNVVIRDKNDFIEADFKIDTIKPNTQSILSGKITVVDGSAFRQFDLRNFVIQAAAKDPSGFGKTLENIDLMLDLDIAVRQFKASMRMLNIDVDALLTGQVKAQGSIGRPKFTGALSVSEGAVNFPAIGFDLSQSRIELDELSDKPFDPKIMIVSAQEFDKEYFPVSQDTTIELSLRGNLDRLNLELKPISGDMRLSQTKIFMMLLSPRGLVNSNDKFGGIAEGAKNAAVAITGEYLLRPLTNELQEFLEGTTKTRIQFGSFVEPTGVTLRLNWKIGPRIEVQGSYMFVTEDIRAPGEDQLSLFGSYPFRDLKLKLLLFDHRPLGPLFFESAFGANRYVDGNIEPRAKVRLNYRILSR